MGVVSDWTIPSCVPIEEVTINFNDDSDEMDGDVALDDCCVATEDYTAASVDELDLYEGQVVCVIDDSDTGKLSLHIFMCYDPLISTCS